jgi:hypothetical protein
MLGHFLANRAPPTTGPKKRHKKSDAESVTQTPYKQNKKNRRHRKATQRRHNERNAGWATKRLMPAILAQN